MNEHEKSQDRYARRNTTEGAELRAEAKEKQAEKAEKAMGAKERIEVTSREAKTTKNQIQNIVANMQSVVAAVAAIRAQLGVTTSGSIPSVDRDQKTLEQLRAKLARLNGEISDLKNALLVEELKAAREEAPNAPDEIIKKEAEHRVASILAKLRIE